MNVYQDYKKIIVVATHFIVFFLHNLFGLTSNILGSSGTDPEELNDKQPNNLNLSKIFFISHSDSQTTIYYK